MDDDFEYSNNGATGGTAGDDNLARSQLIDNQHYDEALSVSGDDFDNNHHNNNNNIDHSNQDDDMMNNRDDYQQQRHQQQDDDQQQPNQYNSDDIIDNNEDMPPSENAGDQAAGGNAPKASKVPLYDPSKYAHLRVSAEVQDLFDHIGRYTPVDIELDTKLTPFIPDYIPAIGEMDAFLKVPPPDGSDDNLGLLVLDEPCAQQSDPTVLDLQLRVVSKHSHVKPMTVRSIEDAAKHPKKITKWIDNIADVHRKKPPPTVVYSKTMPDIDSLMQVWPPAMEKLLQNITLPTTSCDMDVKAYAETMCALLDIPVYEGATIESLHVLFTLYSEFKNNSHFAS